MRIAKSDSVAHSIRFMLYAALHARLECSLDRWIKMQGIYADRSSKASAFTSSIRTISSISKVSDIKIVPELYPPLRTSPCT